MYVIHKYVITLYFIQNGILMYVMYSVASQQGNSKSISIVGLLISPITFMIHSRYTIWAGI